VFTDDSIYQTRYPFVNTIKANTGGGPTPPAACTPPDGPTQPGPKQTSKTKPAQSS